MHKNTPVVDMVIDETGFIAKLPKVHDERHLPVGIHIHQSGIDRKALNDWWLGRSIPASRDGLSEALLTLDISSPTLLIEECYGLSLSDHYWICPQESGLKWENVNFFNNDFSSDVGMILFGQAPNDPAHISLVSPDNTSDGWLRKKWIIAGGKRYLMKGGSGVFQQEPFNEVIASAIMKALGVHHIGYTLTIDHEKPYSLCENFITQATELVPAWRIIQALKKSNQDSDFTHLLRCCEHLGIPDVEGMLGKMLTIDYIIANEDRHYSNFGFVRNAETLKWIGFAPVYDSGTSLWYATARVGRSVECKPFRQSHDQQIELVRDLSWYNFDALTRIDKIVIEILAEASEVDKTRRDEIARLVKERAKTIELRSRQKPSILAGLETNQVKTKPCSVSKGKARQRRNREIT
jgi:hypothetical protein